MKKQLQRSLLLAVLMIFSTAGAWALTADLSMEYELAGYKAKAFYDLTSNDAGVMPVSGDLRYREGWGLFDFGAGNRSADVAIPVSETDVLVCQFADTQGRSVTINSISGCTLSTTLSDGSHMFFEVDETQSAITFNIGRGGCVVSVLVMEKDAEAATADYTLNYVLGETIVKTVTANGAVGGTVLTDASFFADDVKYFRADGEPESFTIAASGNNFTVNVREAGYYGYTLTDNAGTTLTVGSNYEGETVAVPYPRYQLKENTFYEAATTNKEYRKTITLTADNATASVEYTEKSDVNVVFYKEGEEIAGFEYTTSGNIPVRASNATAGVATEDVTITTLAPGKYKLHVGIFASKTGIEEKVVNFGIGENVFAAGFGAVNLNEVASEEYTLNAEAIVKFIAEGTWEDAQFDYIWIEKTGDVTVDPAAAALAAAKQALEEAIGKATALNAQLNDADLNAAIATATAALNAEDATVMSLAAAGQALEAAVKDAAKKALATAIAAAKAQAAEALAEQIADAEAVYGNADATAEDLVTALQAMNAAALDYMKGVLTAAITQATTANETLKDDNLTAAITAAQAALDNPAATVITLSAAAQALKAAGEAAALAYAKAQLQAAIDKVKAYGISDTSLDNIIAAAQSSVDDPEATVQSLQDAGVAFQAAMMSYLKGTLSQAIDMAGTFIVYINKATGSDALSKPIADAKTNAQAVLANMDATPEQLVAALQSLMNAVTPYAKMGLGLILQKVNDLVSNAAILEIEIGEDLTNAIAAAAAVNANNDATLQEIYAALQVLMDAALEPSKAALNKVITLANNINGDESFTTALDAAKAVAADEDATTFDIATVLQELMSASLEPAKAMLQKTIELAEMLGSATLEPIITQAKALLAKEDVTVMELAAGLKALAEAAQPEAKNLLQTAMQYMATFDGNAAAELAGDFAKLNTDIENQDFSAIKADIDALLEKALPYVQSAIGKLEEYAAVMDNETLNNDIAALKTAFAAKDFGGMFNAIKQFETDFCGVAQVYLTKVKAIDTTGKEGVEALNTAIAALETELAAESPKLMAVALATRNLVLAVADFNALNNPLYVETDLTSQFATLTDVDNWIEAIGGSKAYAGWAAPQVTVNGKKVNLIEDYGQGEDFKHKTGDVMYQVVTGLKPGTYAIELYGAACLTEGRADMTTEFAEGDANSQIAAYLYAQSGDQTVKEYIPCLIESNMNNRGGEEAIPSVKLNGIVVGEDGQIKIGLAKELGLTNWHFVQLKSVIAQVNAYDLLATYQEEATELLKENMEAAIKDALADANAIKKINLTAENAKEILDAFGATIGAATASIAAYKNAADILPQMKQLTESTNVYTAEALDTYYTQWQAKYDNATLTTDEANALQDPYKNTGWSHDAGKTCDDLLLSAWSIGETKAKDYEAGLYINTWSTEGDGDGTNFAVPFYEYFAGDTNSLEATTLTATLEGIAAGTYNATVWVRVRAKNGTAEDGATGITLQVNDGEETDVCTGEKVAQGESFFKIAEFTATGEVGEDGVLNIKFNVAAENTISWLSFQNVIFSVKEPEPEPIVFPSDAIVYDFAAAAVAGENPANKNGSAGNGQAFYGWEKADKTDSKRQDYKGYEWAEGSVLPEVCHVWRRSDRINGNVADGGLKCPSNKEMAIDGLVDGNKVIIVYDATGAAEDSKEIIWAIGDGTSDGGPGTVRATATIDGVEAVTGTTTIASGAEILVNSVTPADNGSGYIVFQVKKGMIIKQIAILPGTATGIDTIAAGQQVADGIYTIAGQRVTKAQKGLYIINGKKVVMK